jgi:hypothetical protein
MAHGLLPRRRRLYAEQIYYRQVERALVHKYAQPIEFIMLFYLTRKNVTY